MKKILLAIMLALSMAAGLAAQPQQSTSYAQVEDQRTFLATQYANATVIVPIRIGVVNHQLTYAASTAVTGLTVTVSITTGSTYAACGSASTNLGDTITCSGAATSMKVVYSAYVGSGSIDATYFGTSNGVLSSNGQGAATDVAYWVTPGLLSGDSSLTYTANGGPLKLLGTLQLGGTDVNLLRDSANSLAMRNGANGQTLQLYNSYTDASNYERFTVGRIVAFGNAVGIYSNALGTGTQRSLFIGGGAISIFQDQVGAGGVTWAFDRLTAEFTPQTDNSYAIGDATHRASNIFSALGTFTGITVNGAASTGNLNVTGGIYFNALTAEGGTKSAVCWDSATSQLESNAAATCTVSTLGLKDYIGDISSADALHIIDSMRPAIFQDKDGADGPRFGFAAEWTDLVD